MEFNDENHVFNASITIPNAVNVVVTLTLNGYDLRFMQNTDSGTWKMLYNNRPQFAQSFTIVNVQGGKPKPTPSVWHNAVGQRQPDDRLIHFASQNVTMQSNFAANLFEFVGGAGQAISCVRFTFDVNYVYNYWNVFNSNIMYLILQSATAVAFVNSTFIEENQFSAIVYDLSAYNFIANVSIFGYENGLKPVDYRPILKIYKNIKHL